MGLKPRPDAPLELHMSAAGGSFSRSATVDLRSGSCEATASSRDWNRKDPHWVQRRYSFVVPPDDLRLLRRTAAAILGDGDTELREQFAQQSVSFTARSHRATATADFHIDVGVSTRYDPAWDTVFDRANRAERST